MSLEELQRKRKQIRKNSEITLENMNKITNESYRVADVAHNSREILDSLDKEFESQTGLKGADIAFLFIATALQCARIFIINNLTKIEKAGQGNRNEDFLHELQKKILNKFDDGTILGAQQYYAPLNQIITGRGVPYDATRYVSENFKLFKGANHRFATLGHDPILGLIFGTANILTNTITCVNGPMIITTNHVYYDLNLKNPQIGKPSKTRLMLKKALERLDGDVSSVVAAIIKQVIHIGTDMYTPCGIQLPGANLLLSKQNAEKLTKYISTGDIVKIGASAGLATMINTIISTIHMMMYDEKKYESQELYSVKTRKIVMYSNIIASSSNVIWVGGNMIAGNEGAIKQLDIGGLIVTLHRLMTDTKFIRQVKEEFILGGFNKMIQGDELNLKEITLGE
ncbi:hypothetical protein [Clostridium disporicum]|uniref:Uncharacterized protein n=1 Tax=Clostridium disporicum TaxID=84024 RepID=A0A174EBH6_9CLOT|nr:hypothetical protein [Clostridium disporicum]CUO34118.1 Uncharacterised protein [Clostridium disporicum]